MFGGKMKITKTLCLRLISIVGAVLVCIGCFLPWTWYYVKGFDGSSSSVMAEWLLFFVAIMVVATLSKKPVVNVVCSILGLLVVSVYIYGILQNFQSISRLDISGLYFFIAGCCVVLITDIMLTIFDYKKNLFVAPKRALFITSFTLPFLILFIGFFLFRWRITYGWVDIDAFRLSTIILTAIFVSIGSVISYFVSKNLRITPSWGEYIADVGIIIQSFGFLYFVVGITSILIAGSHGVETSISMGSICYGIWLIVLGSMLLVGGKSSIKKVSCNG